MSSLDYFADVKLNFLGQCALALIIFGIVLYIFSFIFGYTKRFIKSYKGTVDILDSLKSAERKMYVSNNPKDRTYLNIPRSYNEENGVEFTYQLWMLVENWHTRPGLLKHVFHKGNEIVPADEHNAPQPPTGFGGTSDFKIPLLNAPGVYLGRNHNQLLVVMNTFDNPGRKTPTDLTPPENDSTHEGGAGGEDEVLVVKNIPINKWVLITVMLEGQQLKVYKNGYLIASKMLKSYPRQNSSPIHINDMNGYRGFISKIRYYNYAVDQSEIESYVNAGPGSSACLKNKDIPRYMSNTYIDSKYTANK